MMHRTSSVFALVALAALQAACSAARDGDSIVMAVAVAEERTDVRRDAPLLPAGRLPSDLTAAGDDFATVCRSVAACSSAY